MQYIYIIRHYRCSIILILIEDFVLCIYIYIISECRRRHGCRVAGCTALLSLAGVRVCNIAYLNIIENRCWGYVQFPPWAKSIGFWAYFIIIITIIIDIAGYLHILHVLQCAAGNIKYVDTASASKALANWQWKRADCSILLSSSLLYTYIQYEMIITIYSYYDNNLDWLKCLSTWGYRKFLRVCLSSNAKTSDGMSAFEWILYESVCTMSHDSFRIEDRAFGMSQI